MRYLLKAKAGAKLILLMILTMFSCNNKHPSSLITYPEKKSLQETDLQKRSRFFNEYMEEIFPSYELKNGEYLFILPDGCTNCTKSTCSFLNLHPDNVRGKYNAILISQSTLEKFPEKISSLDTNLLIDSTNKLDKMAFGIAGIAVMKIKDNQIVDKKSMTAEDFQKNPAEFFRPM